jgi:hypothetical protein
MFRIGHAWREERAIGGIIASEVHRPGGRRSTTALPTPEITAVSKPNSSPPSAAAIVQATTVRLGGTLAPGFRKFT